MHGKHDALTAAAVCRASFCFNPVSTTAMCSFRSSFAVVPSLLMACYLSLSELCTRG